jgi:hypothetical protein
MTRPALIKILFGCLVVVCMLISGYYWLQNNWNSHYIAAKCEQRVKAECTPVILQSWATNLLGHAQDFTNSESSGIPIPRELQNIWKYQPSVFIREARGTSEAYVYLFWGSGVLGHWGLSIGSPTFAPADWDRQGVQWQPGVYFWRDCH